jgi:thioesterase domain-containing protein
MFWVHPIGGTVLCYRELAQQLGGEHAIWALEAPGVEDGEPLCTIEALAGLYVDAIRAVRPAGPYLLGGWSFGGLVALEMARLLEEAGEEVPLVALVDTSTPGLDARIPEEELLAALVRETGDEGRARRLLRVAVAHLQAQSTYSGRSVPHGAVLFQAADPPAGTPRDEQTGWQSFPGRLETVPGDHHSLWRDPHVRQLAERLRARLREAGAVRTET